MLRNGSSFRNTRRLLTPKAHVVLLSSLPMTELLTCIANRTSLSSGNIRIKVSATGERARASIFGPSSIGQLDLYSTATVLYSISFASVPPRITSRISLHRAVPWSGLQSTSKYVQPTIRRDPDVTEKAGSLGLTSRGRIVGGTVHTVLVGSRK
jgi:hypothetical protein